MSSKLSTLFGIGVQNMILVIILVGLTGWSLPHYLEPVARSALWENELARLKMETSQQAWALYDRVSLLRRDVFYLANRLERHQGDRALLDGRNGDPGMRQKCLRIEVWPVIRAGDHFAFDPTRTIEDLGGSASAKPKGGELDEAQKQILMVDEPSRGVEISPIVPVNPRSRGEPGRSPPAPKPDASQYVIWVGKYFGGGPKGDSRDSKSVLMVEISLDDLFEDLDGSPQHLAAVFQGREVLLPAAGVTRDTEGSPAYRAAVQRLFHDGLYGPSGQIPPDFFSQTLSSRVMTGRTTPLASLPRNAGVAFYSSESGNLDALTGTDREKAAIALDRLNSRWVTDQWSGRNQHLQRVGGLRDGQPRIRLLASEEQRLPELQTEVLRAVEAAIPGSRGLLSQVRWDAASTADRCALGYVAVDLDLEGNRHTLILGRALLHWELGWVRYWAWIWGGTAALVALVSSLVITRPLQRMTKAAWAIADAKADPVSPSPHGTWETTIAEVSKKLPTSRWDEIGVLARAFQAALTEIRDSHVELLQLNRDLEARVQRRTEQQKRFVFSISHDLKTPLTTIKGYCELLMQSTLTDEQREDLSTIYVARERLQRLIEDVIDSQKIDLRELELDWKAVDIARLVREVGRGMIPLAQKNGNVLRVECTEGLPPMYSDPDKISRVLTNLLSNACKFTRQGTITLCASCEKRDDRDWLVLTVADNGPGIDTAHQDRIFKPFPRIMEKKDNPDGTGLGLSNCQGYAEAMGGTIGFHSEVGRGTTFTMCLPTQPDKDNPGAARALEMQSSRRAFPSGRNAALQGNAVLVIDDDAEVRTLLKRFLEKRGFSVAMAADGADGIAQARRLRPVLITLDAVMPGRDGWSVLKELKSAPQTRDIPVIMISILDDKSKGFALGAAEYITKPIDWDRLTRMLKYLDRNRPASILVIDDDPEIRTAARRHLAGHGWGVVEAENGQAALDRLGESRPSVILLDLLMPQMDGFEFLQQLRKNDTWNDIPIIVLTAKDLSGAERDQLTGRVVEVIRKGVLNWDEIESEVDRFAVEYVKRSAAATNS